MIYNAEDKWNEDAPHLEHRSHKYYMKIGQGATARYFYSPQEYAIYQRGLSRGQRTPNETQNLRANANSANRATYQATSRLNNTQIRREKQAAAARNESRLIAKKNVRSNSRDSNDVRNLNNTNNRAQREKNEAIDRLKKTQVRKEQQAATERNKREAAGKRREARKQAYVDFQRNRGKKPAKPTTVNPKREQNSLRKANAARKAYAKAHPIETGVKKARKAANSAYKSASKAANSAYKSASKAANSAYKSAKKAYNSKQGKAVRKKVKRTAQSAYKRGSSFVKKLFNR